MEKIGNVLIDDSLYPGEDYYCDGPVEDRLLEIVTMHDPSEYEDIIAAESSWPILYHLTHLRENIVSFLPSNKNAKVLEIGAGCGAITGALSEKYKSVTSVDLSKKRSLINATRHKDLDNIEIKLGNFEDIEPTLPCDYDYIFLIGVFEYARGYIHSQDPFGDFLKIIKKHTAENGRIVIAIENQYGLKYFAGCKEDHAGLYYEGIADYPGDGVARTFGRKGWIDLMERCGITKDSYHFYYPYPDYKLPTVIYSDDYLPSVGELTNNMRNFDHERLLTFDEKQAFDGMIRQGYFPDFSNSFLIVIGKKPEVVYTKFSNDRRPRYRIRTSICDMEKREVIKFADNPKALEHIHNLESSFRALTKRYEGSEADVNRCRLVKAAGGEAACLEYVEGTSLEELLDECIRLGDVAGFENLLARFDKLCAYGEKEEISDFDLIYPNVLLQKNGRLCIIDYEWTFPVSRGRYEAMTRAMLVYMTGPEKRRAFVFQHGIATRYGITEENLDEHALMEKEFQHEVTGARLSMYELYDRMKKPALPYLKVYNEWEPLKTPSHVYQIYYDHGKGYSEDDSERHTDACIDENRLHKITFFACDKETPLRGLRIDPLMERCILKDVTVLINGVSIPMKEFAGNGHLLPGGSYLYGDEDPHMEISMKALKKLPGFKLEEKNRLEFSASVLFPDDKLSAVLF